MEEATENGKESSHSVHASGMNELPCLGALVGSCCMITYNEYTLSFVTALH